MAIHFPADKQEQEKDRKGDLFYDEKTLEKFHEAMKAAGVTGMLLRTAVINELQNRGLLIRERGNF